MTKNTTDKILCVDDEDNILAMFRRTLGREFSIYTAHSGEDAISLIHEQGEFAVIVSDYSMPSCNGVELLKLARVLSPNSVQIMLTGNIELDIIIKAVNETNVFRYLPKPYPMQDLKKVIYDALNQYHLIIDKQQLTIELERKNNELASSIALLAKQKNLLEYELEMAKIVYNKLYSYGHSELSGLDYLIKAKETAGGDFLLTHINSTSKSFYLMMGDLTGHGLSSAIAVLLVTEIFDTTCLENPSIEYLACSINDKMCRKLPTGLFCAALLLKLDWELGILKIWQGGMPETYLLDDNGVLLSKITSNNLPLGVLANQDFSKSIITLDASIATSLFAYSDGVVEQRNEHQLMYGDELLQKSLQTPCINQRRVDNVLESLGLHQNQTPQCDDISIIELHLSKITKTLKLHEEPHASLDDHL